MNSPTNLGIENVLRRFRYCESPEGILPGNYSQDLAFSLLGDMPAQAHICENPISVSMEFREVLFPLIEPGFVVCVRLAARTAEQQSLEVRKYTYIVEKPSPL